MSDWKLLNTSTASGAANVSFTDLTGYKIFKFVFVDVNPATDITHLQFQTSTDGGSSYGVTTTTTYFDVYHNENGAANDLAYRSANDLAQSTSYQILMANIGSGADECGAGELFLFNPASTTYVKHFYSRNNYYQSSDVCYGSFVAGYFNTTTALNAIDFKMSSGNLDAVIKQYGLIAT